MLLPNARSTQSKNLGWLHGLKKVFFLVILAGLVRILRWTLAKDAGACHFELVGTNGRRNELFFAGKKKLRGAHLSVLAEEGQRRRRLHRARRRRLAGHPDELLAARRPDPFEARMPQSSPPLPHEEAPPQSVAVAVTVSGTSTTLMQRCCEVGHWRPADGRSG